MAFTQCVFLLMKRPEHSRRKIETTMDKTQKLIALTGLTVIVLMGLYPPWVYLDEEKVAHPMGYAFIWKPPVEHRQDSANFFGITLKLDTQSQSANHIDMMRLALQIAVTAVVMGGVMILMKSSRRAS